MNVRDVNIDIGFPDPVEEGWGDVGRGDGTEISGDNERCYALRTREDLGRRCRWSA